MSNHAPTNSLPSRYRTFDSGSEDFRSIIDDLTVENRNLKRKIKHYEGIHYTQLHADRLFEVRVHGLPLHKKRKLERTLQDFASSLGEETEARSPSLLARNVASSCRIADGFNLSPSTSNSRPVDSAYASMSNSGGASILQSQHYGAKNSSRLPLVRDQEVRSYLRTIPQRISSKDSFPLTEKAKKHLVVKRLEQLFTGKTASSSLHSQHVQQQEISQSAAIADRRDTEAKGLRVYAEGVREAKIMIPDGDDFSTEGDHVRCNHSSDETSSGTTNTSSHVTPNQRPTRPIDIDPSRAQNPVENIEYMKHLGFDSPRMDASEDFEAGRGWVSCNLLINMAQLHTINVTPDFVRDAVLKFSKKFELSPDAKKMRWRSGTREIWMNEGGSGQSSGYNNDSYQEDREGPCESTATSGSSGELAHAQLLRRRSPSSSSRSCAFNLANHPGYVSDDFQYKPLFHHAQKKNAQKSSLSERASTMSTSSPMKRAECCFSDQHSSTPSFCTNQCESMSTVGPIIFYSHASFYTDLSQDPGDLSYASPTYTRYSESIIGYDIHDSGSEQNLAEIRGPLSDSLPKESCPVIDIKSYHVADGLRILSAKAYDAIVKQSSQLHLEASGVGGVHPTDNFSIEVQIRHTMMPLRSHSEIVSARYIALPPSTLPPPSYTFHQFSSSVSDEGSHDDGGSEEVSVAEITHGSNLIQHILRPATLGGRSSKALRPVSAYSSDNSSIDLLAHARAIDPQAIEAHEQVYEECTRPL